MIVDFDVVSSLYIMIVGSDVVGIMFALFICIWGGWLDDYIVNICVNNRLHEFFVNVSLNCCGWGDSLI